MDTANLDPIALITEAFTNFEAVKAENTELRESVAEVRAMLDYEDRGWALIGQVLIGDHLEGLDLQEVQDIAKKVAPKVVGGSLPKRAVDLHAGFTWGRGCYIEGTEKPKGPGRKPAARSFFVNPVNQESIFSESAHQELQKARFIDGNVLVAVNSKTATVNRIPFSQITGLKVDRDFPENILMYKRTWDTKDGTEDSTRSVWYYTKRFKGVRRQYVTEETGRVPIAQDTTVVDLRVNRQVGHVLGVPDALAGILWSETYGRVISYGETVQEGLAKIIFRVTSKTAKGVQSTGVKIAGAQGHGNTASMAEGQELSAVSTAGRGYDYASARPVAAMAAAAWNVSNMDLLNDSSAAGSSYGSANALVGGNRNAMLLMQKEWAGFIKDIFEAANLERPTIVFEPFEAPDKYREAQALTLLSPGLDDVELRTATLDILDIVGDATQIPDTLKARSEPEQTAAQQASPDQGVANGTNSGGGGANDQRTDTLSSQEAIRREMALEDQLARMAELVERFEALNA